MANTKITSRVIADNSVGIDALNVTDGTNGQALVTDGSGGLSFASVGVSGIVSSADATAITIDSSENVTFTGTGQATRLGLGVAPHATAALNITTTDQHMRLNNGAELGIIELDSDGRLNIWAHGDNETINLKTGTGSGSNVLSVVGNDVGIGTTSPVAPLTINDKATISFNVNDFALGHNLYYDSTDDRWERLSGSEGSALYQTAGTIIFYRTAGSAAGVTGDAVTPTESMRIASNGDVQLQGGNQMTNAISWWNAATYELASIENVSHPSYNDSGGLLFKTAGLSNSGMAERMRIGSSGGITISNSPANTGEGLGQPDMSKTTEGGIHFTSGGTQTSKGITWEAGGSGETQAGIVCHNNDSNGTHLGFFTTYSYGAGPLCQMKLDQYGSLILGASIDVTSVNSPSQHNAIFVSAGDIVVDSAHGNVELSDLLPGYTRGDYNCVKSSGSNLYFAVNGSYVSYINHNGTYTISDSRLKENVTTLTGSLEKIKQLRGVNFTWLDTESRGSDTHLGFIAQEVEPYFPEAVGDGGLPNPNDENDEPYKNVSYATLVPALVEAIKELSSELDAAKARIETLENA